MKTKQVKRSIQLAVICVEKGEALCMCICVHIAHVCVCAFKEYLWKEHRKLVIVPSSGEKDYKDEKKKIEFSVLFCRIVFVFHHVHALFF